MTKGNPQINNLVHQHQDLLRQREIKAEEKKKEPDKRNIPRYLSPFEGSCTSMNRNETHTKSYRKTQRALMKV